MASNEEDQRSTTSSSSGDDDAATVRDDADVDLESQKSEPHPREPHWKKVFEPALITPTLIRHPWSGTGSETDPFLVDFVLSDPQNPKNFSNWQKWAFTLIMAVATFSVALSSSAYTGGIVEVVEDFKTTELIATLGVSLFVLGFAIGPLLWAPLSELFGRQVIFVVTFGAFTAFNAAATGSKNIQTLIVLRLLAGVFGSSPLTNAGGVISDLFESRERGRATMLFSAAPSMGPIAGPIIGGFIGENVGWKWIQGVLAIFTGTLWIIGALAVPETYAPVLLKRRAAALSKKTGKHFISLLERDNTKTPRQLFRTALMRPWQLLIYEPICLLLSIYMAIIYGTLYLTFGAFPIVFEEKRGWSQGIGGLAFLGVAVGMILGLGYYAIDNRRYIRVANKSPGGFAPPETRLPPLFLGSILLPVGLIWFAWTCYPSIHWIVSIIGIAPFGFGLNVLFLGIINYLIDACKFHL